MEHAKQRLHAPNDRNGNPRRLWILYRFETTERGERTQIAKIRDEGYRGEPRDGKWDTRHMPTIYIDADEYNRILEEWGAHVEHS